MLDFSSMKLRRFVARDVGDGAAADFPVRHSACLRRHVRQAVGACVMS